MSWEELKETIGQDARQIIENDRGQQMSSGKVSCFMTEHKSTPELTWISEGLKFFCHNCEEKYDIIDHVKWLAHDDMKQAYTILCELSGSEPSKINDKPVVIPKIKADAEEKEVLFPSVMPLEALLRQKAGHYLCGRGLTRETLLEYRLTSNSEAVFFNYYVDDTLVKIKGRAIGDMGNSKDKYKYTPKGGTNTLYGQHMYSGQRTVAICEGEIDALSLHTAIVANGLQEIVLSSSVPSGSGNTSWIENSRHFLDKFESIVLIPDNDDAGKKFIDKASAELVMIKPVRTATLKGTKCNDVNELLQERGTKEVCRLIANSKEYLPDFAVDLSKLPYNESRINYERSGFFTLDKMLHGFGHGLVTLFTGHTGAGKTTIIRQMIIFNVMQKKRIGVMMGEETPLMFRDMLIRQRYLKDHSNEFNKIYDEWDNNTWTPKDKLIEKFNDECSRFISSYNCAHLQDDNRLKKIYEWIRFESSIYGTSLFILDNLMKLEVGLGDGLTQAQGDIIDAVKNMSSTLNVHILLIAHPKKGESNLSSESVSGSQKIVNTVDNLITFQRFDKMDERVVSKIVSSFNSDNRYENITAFLRIHKNRVWAKCGMIPMRYDEHTNCIHDLDPENKQRYGWTINGRTYEP